MGGSNSMKKYLTILIFLLLLLSPPASADDGFNHWKNRPTPDPSLPTPTPSPTSIPASTYPINIDPWLTADRPYNTGHCPLVNGWGWTGYLSWPIDGTIHEGRAFRFGHRGIDIDAPNLSPVFASASGVVVWAGFHINGFGNLVALAHGNGWQTFYAHLDTVSVGCGEYVQRGEQIGTTGLTGGTTFPHLHFEVRNNRLAYNPLQFLEN